MWDLVKDSILDAGKDSMNLLLFLFLTYLVMEIIEHKMGDRAKNAIHRAEKTGPLIGGALGIIPQCGFSTVASNLYAGRIITVGTLLSVYLSTSDEMLPIMISQSVDATVILKILAVKFIVAVAAGFLVDIAVRIFKGNNKEDTIKGRLYWNEQHDHERSILESAAIHTLRIFIFILLISFGLNIVTGVVGVDILKQMMAGSPVIGALAAGVVGLIPNCAASVVITELYLSNMISVGALFSGLLVGAGVGLLVLFRINNHLKENLKITVALYAIGVTAGSLIEFIFGMFGITRV